MKKLYTLLAAALLLAACGGDASQDDGTVDITQKFNSTWNIHETVATDGDGNIVYNSVTWGGLCAVVTENNLPADWSDYESIVVEFAQPTPVDTKLVVTEKLQTYGKAGISRLECNFGGQDLTAVSQVALQATDDATFVVKRVYLTKAVSVTPKYSTMLWSGRCVFGNWVGGFQVTPDRFSSASEGDQLELIYTTDSSDPSITYWQIKTALKDMDVPLEGNASELNAWGCTLVSEGSTTYRITLTAGDVTNLRERGLFVNGYYCVATQCNLLQ